MQGGGTSLGDLVGDGLTSGTREAGNDIGVTWGDGDISKVLRCRWDSVPGCVAGSNLGQLSEVKLAVTAEGVVGCLEVGLLGEHEDQVTSRTLK